MSAHPPVLLTTQDAAEQLGVPETVIAKWKHRGLVSPAGVVPGRGRGGRVPLYRLDELRPLATRYHTQKATRRDDG